MGRRDSLLLGVRNLTVDYPGTRALEDVSLDICRGDVLAVVGANGSGKTTLLSVLCGLLKPTHGVLLDGQGEFAMRGPGDALRRGIVLCAQEPQLAPTLSCLENVMIGTRRRFVFFADRTKTAEAREALASGLPRIPTSRIAGDLIKADRAILALICGLQRRPQVLALDEPTAVLGEDSIRIVGDAVRSVTEQGGAAILVSHRLQDVTELATKLAVLVDGRLVFLGSMAGLSSGDIITKLIRGREPDDHSPVNHLGKGAHGSLVREQTEVLLRLSGLETKDGGKIDCLEVRSGDILGIAGLAGSGCSHLLGLLAGNIRPVSGILETPTGRVAMGQPFSARKKGIAHIPEDRALEGIFPCLDVTGNVTATTEVAFRRMVSPARGQAERRTALDLIRRFNIKCSKPSALITSLSGGNQQRAVLARGMGMSPTVIVADEPTQGVDAFGRASIHSMLRDHSRGGGAVVFSSSDFDELLELSTRVMVMRDGHLLGELGPEQATYHSVLSLATGAGHWAERKGR